MYLILGDGYTYHVSQIVYLIFSWGPAIFNFQDFPEKRVDLREIETFTQSLDDGVMISGRIVRIQKACGFQIGTRIMLFQNLKIIMKILIYIYLNTNLDHKCQGNLGHVWIIEKYDTKLKFRILHCCMFYPGSFKMQHVLNCYKRKFILEYLLFLCISPELKIIEKKTHKFNFTLTSPLTTKR